MSQQTVQIISGRLSLRTPQRESLESLQKAIAAAPDILHPNRDVPALLEIL
ncbi:MAG: hypothetical protein WCG16_01075 [Methylococcales bacterium]